MTSADDTSHPDILPPTATFTPPPHLTARFSPRRPASPRSTSLAANRRQLLLEARKSTLRARAAHIERVRRSRASEHDAVAERLLALQASLNAAEKSRDAILARITRSCAKEVAKAKRTAVEMRTRREKELRRLKENVEGRMVQAERRRESLLLERGRKGRKGSTSSASSGRMEGTSEDEVSSGPENAGRKTTEQDKERAARRIQRVWRRRADRRLVDGFTRLGLTIEGVRDADFIEISSRLQDESVLGATSALLKRAGLLDGEKDEVACLKASRTFLSAYLILGHPAEVLSYDSEIERDLITQSKHLLIAFESFLSAPSFPPPPGLKTAWDAFKTGFDTWKAVDQKNFIDIMVAQYAELDLIWQKVKNDTSGKVADDYKEGIRDNQLQLLVRIRRLAGERTLEMIRAAIKEARRTRLPKRSKKDTKPREAPLPETAPPSAAAASAPSEAVSAATTATQPSGNHFDVLSEAQTSNRQIIHELSIDPDFRLKRQKHTGVVRMVEDTAKRAFWDIMRADIAEGKLEKWIPSLAETVKNKILRLLEPSKSLYREVSDSIDVDLIRQQCAIGSYDHERLLSYVFDLLPRICSPARDADVQALREATDMEYTQRLQRLLDVLEDMQLDHANFLLQVMKPQVIPHAIPYEQAAFAADLAANRTSLTKTRAWLLEAKSQLPEGANAKEIHTHAFLNLLFSDALDDSKVPETLHLDFARLHEARANLRRIVLGSAITITTKMVLRRGSRSTWKDLQTRVVALLSGANTPEQVADGVKDFLESTTATPQQTREAVQKQLAKILTRGTEDPVARAMNNRIRGFVKERLLADASADRVRLAANAGEELAGWGISEWISDLAALTERLQAWRAVDTGVHVKWYNEILGASA